MGLLLLASGVTGLFKLANCPQIAVPLAVQILAIPACIYIFTSLFTKISEAPKFLTA